MAKTVAFINFKGGVGKTTICVEVAASLVARFNAKVLIVDLDPQTNATLSLMKEDEWERHANTKGTLREFFQACYEDKPFDLATIRHEYTKHYLARNLHIVPSHLELFGMDLLLATKFGHGDVKAKVFLRRALKTLSANYDFILIDCPPNIYLATQNGLFASDYYVVVALAEYLSTLGLAHIQKSINGVFESANKSLEDISGNSKDVLNNPRKSKAGNVGIALYHFLRRKGSKVMQIFVSKASGDALQTDYPCKASKCFLAMKRLASAAVTSSR